MTTSAPEPTPPSTIDAAALAFAERFGLVREDGSIKCIKPLCGRDGKPPSLCCEICANQRQRGYR